MYLEKKSNKQLPIKFFSGAGGIILPLRKYFPAKISYNPKKSLNLLNVLNCFFLNFGIFVLVVTLMYGKKCGKFFS